MNVRMVGYILLNPIIGLNKATGNNKGFAHFLFLTGDLRGFGGLVVTLRETLPVFLLRVVVTFVDDESF